MTLARQAIMTAFGGPEVIAWHSVELPPPGPGEVTVRQSAVGLNYIDTYHRSGLYPSTLPVGLGLESAGTIAAVGEGVHGLSVGDRVATFGPARGAYADIRNVTANSVFALPDDIADDIAAAALLKGCTAEFLVERCGAVFDGETVLVQAAAGGVGLILVQWLKAVGATVIGTAGGPAKAALATAAGADHVIDYLHEDTAAKVREVTSGRGVRVTFDGVGRDTWEASLASTGRRGLIISYGNASGPVTGVALGSLATAGSLFVTRPTLFDYYALPEERAAGAARLWEMIRSGKLTITIGQTYPLEQAEQAHRDLESRATSGSTLLIP